MPALLPHLPTLAAEAPPEAAPEAPFHSAASALLWAAEVLRRRRLPPHSGVLTDRVALGPAQHNYAQLARLNLAQEASQVAAHWGRRFQPNLPHDAGGRLMLALQIEQQLHSLAAPPHHLLRLWAWGDWADDTRLRAALAQQERLRRQGIRARLCYRYSVGQLALHAGVSKATLWRQLHAALRGLEGGLVAQHIVAPPAPPRASAPAPRAAVSRAAFGKYTNS